MRDHYVDPKISVVAKIPDNDNDVDNHDNNPNVSCNNLNGAKGNYLVDWKWG